jgi:hypothetical protein
LPNISKIFNGKIIEIDFLADGDVKYPDKDHAWIILGGEVIHNTLVATQIRLRRKDEVYYLGEWSELAATASNIFNFYSTQAESGSISGQCRPVLYWFVTDEMKIEFRNPSGSSSAHLIALEFEYK